MSAAAPEPKVHLVTNGDPPAVWAMVAILSPVLFATVLLLGFIVSEAAGMRLGTFQDPATVSEALALGDAAAAMALIRAGQDPNERSIVSKGVIDFYQPVRVTSLQAAVLARRPEFIALMLRHGARLNESPRLACLVEAIGLAKDVPPAIVGVDALHDDDVRADGIEALERCGLPSN